LEEIVEIKELKEIKEECKCNKILIVDDIAFNLKSLSLMIF
jgi:hypothetical protein